VVGFEWETGKRADIAYMIDQSHNLKDKIEEMIQTAVTAQELYAKAVLVDQEKLADHQMKGELIDAEECLKAAFASDVRPAIREWRKSKGLADDPLHGPDKRHGVREDLGGTLAVSVTGTLRDRCFLCKKTPHHPQVAVVSLRYSQRGHLAWIRIRERARC